MTDQLGPGTHVLYQYVQRVLSTGKDPEWVLDWARDTWEWTGAFDLRALRTRFNKTRS